MELFARTCRSHPLLGGTRPSDAPRCGEASSRVAVAGCPRLSRELPSPSLEGRRRLGIDHDGPVAMLATSPESIRLESAQAFCGAIEQLPVIPGVVRLHPSEGTWSPMRR